MPNIEELKETKKKVFKKRHYRPYNLEGTSSECQFPKNHEDHVGNPQNTVIEIHPKKVKNWEYHDRPTSELGDIDALAEELLTMGQQIPCIARTIKKDPNFEYELVAGERRWRAALKANIPIKLLVRDLSDSESALVQVLENSNRSSLSDYAKGTSYIRLIKDGILSQSDLVNKLKISKQQVSRLLSFNKIIPRIREVLKDMSRISGGTAEQIKQLSAKSELHIQGVIHYSKQITEGKIGKNKLNILVEKFVNYSDKKTSNKKVCTSSGRHLYSWRNDNNSTTSIYFPNDISLLIKEGKINKKELSESIKKLIENMIVNIR